MHYPPKVKYTFLSLCPSHYYPVGAAPTTSSFSTKHLASRDLSLSAIFPWSYNDNCWPQPTWNKACFISWWRHQMETFSALLDLCVGNSPVSGELPAQRLVTRSFDVFFDLRLIKRLNKHSRGWWFKTLSRSLWRHCNVLRLYIVGKSIRKSYCVPNW